MGDELPDNWLMYINRIAYYLIGNLNIENTMSDRLVSVDESEIMRLAKLRFFNEHIKPRFQKLAIET
jgi:hypothetical protein